MSTAPLPFLTPDQYLEIEQNAEFKSEYWNGQMYAMAGGTGRHSDAAGGLLVAFRTRLKGRGCGVFNSDLRVRDGENGLYTYPDLAVVCGKPVFGPAHTLINPLVLVEVLSPSTEAKDRGFKFARYRHIESFREYVLISPEQPRVETYLLQADRSWRYQSIEGLQSAVAFGSLALEIPLAEIYDGIMFEDWFATAPGA